MLEFQSKKSRNSGKVILKELHPNVGQLSEFIKRQYQKTVLKVRGVTLAVREL